MHEAQIVRAIRQSLSMTQEEFAERFNIGLTRLRSWEQGRTRPVEWQLRFLSGAQALPELMSQICRDVRDAG